MKQIVQNIRNGQLSLGDVPAPTVQPGHLLIANQASLVSAGTEKMIMDLAKKSLIGKAKERPDHVRRVLEKVRNEGIVQTIQQVRRKLDEPMTMGYSSAGIVLEVGRGIENYKPGDRVASNGPHAEFVCVPRHLCARVPDPVSDQAASFAVVASIGLHGFRLAKCQLGETVVVIGLGLIGQICIALAKASGLQVIGTDPDQSKCELARKMGADYAEPNLNEKTVHQLTEGIGADACLITASTKSNQPIEVASAVVRKRGRIVLVGVVGLELDRRAFYFKETEFVVSCSYGPGRYDPEYEDRGHDYPAQYVRWTEQRNIQAVLDMMASGALDVSPLISHRYSFAKAEDAYQMIQDQSEPYVGIVLDYPEIVSNRVSHQLALDSKPSGTVGKIRYGVLGAGNFAKMVLIPAIQKIDEFEPVAICSAKGLTATHAGNTHGFETACTDEDILFADESISTVFAITRHDQHARQVIKAIENGKHIFVEKPLCVSTDELFQIDAAIEQAKDRPVAIMVGYNRRFSPHAIELREFFADANGPLTCSIRFNAGEIPADHWTQHDLEGGGRLIGEACHAIDLATHLVGSPPIRVYCESIARQAESVVNDDQCFITLRHQNGSISSIAYLAGGDKSFPKERIELIGEGRVGVIDDFRAISLTKSGKTNRRRTQMDKGHHEEIRKWCRSLKAGATAPIPWSDLRATTFASIGAVLSLREGGPINLEELESRSASDPS